MERWKNGIMKNYPNFPLFHFDGLAIQKN